MRNIKALSFSLIYALTTIYAVAQNATVATIQLKNFEREVIELQQTLKIPGLSVGIVKDQQLICAKGFGWADVERKVPATKSTIYSIASVTKTFTSVMLMKLVEQGKLDLNDPMSKYDPTIKNDSLKVIHFLTHTSEGSPGQRYRYSGDRYAILQNVIEKITHKTYQELMEQMFLIPTGMKESVAGHDVLEEDSRYKSLRSKLAKPYTLYGNSEIILSPYPPKKITASAGLLSSITDLYKYDVAIDRHQFISAASQQKAWTSYTLTNGVESPYGFGWFTQKLAGNNVYWHFGLWPAYSSMYVKIPEQNITLILLANSDGLTRPFSLSGGNVLNSAFVLSFLRHIVFPSKSNAANISWVADSTRFYNSIAREKSLAQGNFADEIAAYGFINKYLAGRQSRVKPVQIIQPENYKDYVGKYELLPVPITISMVGNKLMVEGPLITSKVELFQETATKFFLKIFNAQIEFLRDGSGKINECNLFLDGVKYQCKKIA